VTHTNCSPDTCCAAHEGTEDSPYANVELQLSSSPGHPEIIVHTGRTGVVRMTAEALVALTARLGGWQAAIIPVDPEWLPLEAVELPRSCTNCSCA
jgi:hypothetical protein